MRRCAGGGTAGDRGSVRTVPRRSALQRRRFAVNFPEPDDHPNQGGRLPGRRVRSSDRHDRRADAPLRAAGKGVFHEFRTAAVWPVRLGSAPADLGAGGPGEPAVALLAGSGRPTCRPGFPPISSSPIRSRISASSTCRRKPINPNNPNSPGLSNEGKVVSGTDRAGDKWAITVHGPGKVIVTDTTPNDGALDDDINTIQLVSTNLNIDLCHRQRDRVQQGARYLRRWLASSRPTARSSSTSSSRPPGVKSIELNGFDLTNQVTPAVTTPTGIFLYGGVGVLSFNSIDPAASTPRSTRRRTRSVIGDATTPLKVQPSIYVNNITNLVFDSSTFVTADSRPRRRRRPSPRLRSSS